MAAPKGHPKWGGKAKGTPNKATADVRATVAAFAENNAAKFELWVQATADGDPANNVKPDPAKAAALYLTAIEYHIPKLARTEVTGKDGDPIETVTRIELVAPKK